MQLKMDKPVKRIDLNKLKKTLMLENKYINDLFSRLAVHIPVKDPYFAEESGYEESRKSNPKTQPTAEQSNGVIGQRAKSLEELQNRLKVLQNKRKYDYKEKLIKKGIKNRITKKTKKEQRALKKKLVKVHKAGQLALTKEEGLETDSKVVSKSSKPIFNSEGKIVFSKFDFSHTGTKDSKKTAKDPKKALENIQKQKEKLKELVASGEKEKAIELKEKFAWKAALAKADGQKIKDDPDLLKKSVKKKEQAKKISARKWEERKDGVKKAHDERQRKREDNINKRKKDKSNKKMKHAVQRGRVIPGF